MAIVWQYSICRLDLDLCLEEASANTLQLKVMANRRWFSLSGKSPYGCRVLCTILVYQMTRYIKLSSGLCHGRVLVG